MNISYVNLFNKVAIYKSVKILRRGIGLIAIIVNPNDRVNSFTIWIFLYIIKVSLHDLKNTTTHTTYKESEHSTIR